MATTVDIFNLALSLIGNKANVASETELSAERQRCSQFYPNCLRSFLTYAGCAWSFAKARSALTAVTNDLEDMWDYKYSLPNLCLRPLAVLPDDAPEDHGGVKYMLQGEYLYTNEEDASLLYIQYLENPGLLPENAVTAVAHLLASRLAGPLIKGAMGRQERDSQYKAYLIARGEAATEDANKSQDFKINTPGGIRARGGDTPTRWWPEVPNNGVDP